MRSLPKSANSLLVRSTRSGSVEWQSLLAVVATKNADGFRAYVDVVDDRRWYGKDIDALRAAMPQTASPVLFVADERALTSPELPILVVDLIQNRRPFRCVGAKLWSVDNNLNTWNMDWEEFADAVDQQGVYRGFS
ncbi:DUF6924 domain-containing protein [Micromonospora sp. DT81.3]|uniref:DUF6924 domain-containing protein n=1 Tax=Micromonospora sp. DT81.3 TaxID=3416523 RepID=UPI003CEFCB59